MTLADKITLSRVAVLPAFGAAFLLAPPAWFWLAAAIYSWVEISDVLDGQVARRTGQISELGKLLDPYCDAVCRGVAFLLLLHVGLCATWMAGVILIREMTVYWLRAQAARVNYILAARFSGKTKAVVHGGTILAALLVPVVGGPVGDLVGVPLVVAGAGDQAAAHGWEIYTDAARGLVNGLCALSAALSVLSILDYLVFTRRLFKDAGASTSAPVMRPARSEDERSARAAD